MRKLYNEFFYIPKHGKIREKVMLTRIVMTITIVIMCLAAMSITAYAYFFCKVTSGANIIKAANFEASVSISTTENDSSTTVEVIKQKNASCNANLKAGKIYTITLDESDGSTSNTGFCIVSAIGCPDIYHSQQIGADAAAESEFTDKVTFQLEVTADTTITFVSHWGTSSYYGYARDSELYIKRGETVQIPVHGVPGTDKPNENDGTEPTTPETTVHTETVHTVAAGESLFMLAEQYNTTVVRLAAYNEITNPRYIQAGQMIKIPPADWVMAENTTPPTTETTKPVETTPEATESTLSTEVQPDEETIDTYTTEANSDESEIN